MLRHTGLVLFFDARSGGPKPWAGKALKRHSHRQMQKHQHAVRSEKYQEGLLGGKSIFDVSIDKERVTKELRNTNGFFHRQSRGNVDFRSSGRHAQQQAQINSNAYMHRQINRLAREDRQSSRIDRLREHHFPMLKDR